MTTTIDSRVDEARQLIAEECADLSLTDRALVAYGVASRYVFDVNCRYSSDSISRDAVMWAEAYLAVAEELNELYVLSN